MMTFRVPGWARRSLLAIAPISLAAGHDAWAQEAVADRVVGLVVDPAGRPVPAAQVVGAFESPGDDPDGELDPASPHRTTTDEAGRFVLDWPSLPVGRGEPAIWVVGAGSRLARSSVARRSAGQLTRVVVEPEVGPATAVVEVVDPRGFAVADARVRPTHWFEGNVAATSARVWAIPPPVGDLLASRTDASGRATLRGVAALRLTAVAVESQLGRQVISWDESIIARQRIIKLRPDGRLTGQVRGDRPGAGAGARIGIATRIEGQVVGRATVTADAAGRFESQVVAGSVEIRLLRRDQDALVAETARLDLGAGAAADAVLALHPGVRIGGKVVERAARRAVVGAWVAVAGPDDSNLRLVPTDANGEFATTTLPGPVTVRLEAVPGDHLLPFTPGRPPRRDVPAAPPGFEWPTLEVDRGVVLRGRVLDDLGRPVGPGVPVRAGWTVRDGRSHDDQAATTETGADGQFLVGPVPPGVDVTLTAHRPGDRPGHRSITPAVGEGAAVEIRLPHPDPMLAPGGRVVDSTGRPVANALVQIRVADPGLVARGPRSGRRLAAPGLDAVVTDALGRYQAAGRVDGRHRYLATAEAAGCESGRTRAIGPRPAPGGETFAFPDLVVERHPDPPVLVGRVVGRDGRPIAGAEVTDLAHHHASADADGWFQLEKVGAAGKTCLFVRHPDYRFAGRTLSPLEADQAVIVVLGRRDEPAAPSEVAARPRDAGARAVVRRLLRSLLVEPSIERVLARQDAVAKVDLLEHLARVEPARVARWLGAGIVSDPRIADGLRRIAARHLAPADFPRAAIVVAGIEDPDARCRATLETLDRAEGLDLAAERDRLEGVEHLARGIADPGRRAVALARVAGGWLDRGDAPRAGMVLAEAGALAEGLPRATEGSRAWCALIEPLARLDPAQAQKRLRHLLDPADLDRCRLAIALGSARSHPAEAVQALRQVRDSRLRLRATAEICYLLGPGARDRARGVADAIRTAHPMESAHALGMLAAALNRRDGPYALSTLDEAFLRLEAAARTDPPTPPEVAAEPAAVAAALLPIVEAVDPTLVPEYFWRAVALRPNRPQPNLRADAILAVLLDRYDPAVARVIFDPDRTRPAAIALVDLPPLLLAATQLAPRLAFEWADHPAGTDEMAATRHPIGDRPHLALITAWTETDRGRWDRAVREYLDLWTPPES